MKKSQMLMKNYIIRCENYSLNQMELILDSVLYFFINKTAYSGMIRYNRNGEYNVSFGRYTNFNTKLMNQ